ncbi:MAG: hypothetical protein DMG26_13170, partial [Acidobacteria bacterium]
MSLEAATNASHCMTAISRGAQAGKGRIRVRPVGAPLLGRLLLLALLLMILLPTAAAADASFQAPAAGLPESCEPAGQTSDQVSTVLQTLSSRASAEGYNTLGALYARRKQFDCAIAAFEKALVLDRGSWDARYNLGLALISRQDYNRAVKELQAAVKTKPESFAAHNALGVAYRALGQLDTAADEFKEALRLNPGFADASLNLADLTLDEKRYVAAIYYLERALAQSPPAQFAERLQTDLAVAYSKNGDYDRAAEVFKKLIALHPNAAKL